MQMEKETEAEMEKEGQRQNYRHFAKSKKSIPLPREKGRQKHGGLRKPASYSGPDKFRSFQIRDPPNSGPDRSGKGGADRKPESESHHETE
jgi:hypothetical protein